MFATCEFNFNETAFQSVFEMLVNKQNKWTGLGLVTGALLLPLLSTLIALMLLSSQTGTFLEKILNEPYLALFLSYSAFGIWCFLFGLYNFLGWHRPRWGTQRWNVRTQICFNQIENGYRLSSFNYNARHALRPIRTVGEGVVFASSIPYRLLFPRTHSFSNIVLFDIIPFLVPSLPGYIPNAISPIPFSVTFYDDKIELGKSGEVFAESYEDIECMVEDKKAPRYVCLIHRETQEVCVVDTCSISGVSWDKLKVKIEREAGETLSEFFFGKKRVRKVSEIRKEYFKTMPHRKK